VAALPQSSSELPDGFVYDPEFISIEEENDLLREIANLEFQPFDFHGYIAKRRIVEYGFEYDFSSRQAQTARPLPAFLDPFRLRAAAWAGIRDDEIIESVITEYSPGSPIGWHRDVPQFEIIIGISLKSSCRFRFKPYRKEGKLLAISLEPRFCLHSARSGTMAIPTQHTGGEDPPVLHHVSHLEKQGGGKAQSFSATPATLNSEPSLRQHLESKRKPYL
jgi:alkylated DNA repair dioxygenase AlkB